MSLHRFIKGWLGELFGAFAHWACLDRSVYKPLNNVTLQTANGTTQIDHILVSRHGIFVIETKNVDGWIFGDAHSAQWTVVKHGRKFRMQNPLHQNFRHVRAVVDFLGVDEDKVRSVVMFWGECEFKTSLPENVLARGYSAYIQGFQEQVFTDTEVQALLDGLRAGAMPQSWATRRRHLASLAARHSSTTCCAKCSSPLVLRTVRKGAQAGRRFYGCSTYPKCRYTVPCPEEA